ncbi:hypothetical protein [Zophobihabitans entericus]|uniref:Uncharacterized protein n=1 Tax=Zophobihabitans entericus TaxID=1635327 RepID=A0A6G9IFC0_9GAMM|nr:hypothetical protein [Zophobihabitans entericus]QIQ22509.1 hypothetical protein IPMB12_11925 [Zophobihabitans entericus]
MLSIISIITIIISLILATLLIINGIYSLKPIYTIFGLFNTNQIEQEHMEWIQYKKEHICKLIERNDISNSYKWDCNKIILINKFKE